MIWICPIETNLNVGCNSDARKLAVLFSITKTANPLKLSNHSYDNIGHPLNIKPKDSLLLIECAYLTMIFVRLDSDCASTTPLVLSQFL